MADRKIEIEKAPALSDAVTRASSGLNRTPTSDAGAEADSANGRGYQGTMTPLNLGQAIESISSEAGTYGVWISRSDQLVRAES